MPDADLEIVLNRWNAGRPGRYGIELTSIPPEGQTVERPLKGDPSWTLDLEGLDLLAGSPARQGLALMRAVFGDPEVRTEFARARRRAADFVNRQTNKRDARLRIRLVIKGDAAELAAVRWETLLDPERLEWPPPDPDVPPDPPPFLVVDQSIRWARYVSSASFKPVLPLSGDDRLTALVVVANPTDIETFEPGGVKLAPIDVADELERAMGGLVAQKVRPPAILTRVAPPGMSAQGPATFSGLVEALRRGPGGPDEGFDLLYLVAHGVQIEGRSFLYLEGPNGEVVPADGLDLAARLHDLPHLPRLVILVSCQSAGTGRSADSSGALSALGPKLAESGVPAVVAMLGSVSMPLMAEFLPRFFDILFEAGQVEDAVSAGRGAVLDAVRERRIGAFNANDIWMPVLFSRLLTGRIWYGGGAEPGGFDQWPGLMQYIQDGKCTPILGSGLVEGIVGPSRELARRWADTYHFPMSPHDREDLPQVAQYLAVNQGKPFPGSELAGYLRRVLVRRLPPGSGLGPAVRAHLQRLDPPPQDVTDALRGALRRRDRAAAEQTSVGALVRDAPEDELLQAATADVLVSAAGALRRAADPREPHRVLASLGLPLYITTNSDRLMADALADAGRSPRIGLFGWKGDLEPESSVFAGNPGFRPDPDQPLVYHLHGRLDEPKDLVLKEDDYFDYLIGVTRDKDNIPPVIRRKLADSALLLLGFQISDWDFRVLFRSLQSQMGAQRRSDYRHVAVQIDPRGENIIEPDLARRYLDRWFQDAQVSIYWGSIEDFIGELSERLASG